MKTTKCIVLIIISIFQFSCASKQTTNYEHEIMNADRAFSDYSVQHGQVAAFLEFAAPDVVLIKPNMYPIVGHKELTKHYEGKVDSTFVITWEPQYAKVAKSGDLGYTYGYWSYYLKVDPTTTYKGTYATAWERQPNGQWKFVLDLGNDGLGDK